MAWTSSQVLGSEERYTVPCSGFFYTHAHAHMSQVLVVTPSPLFLKVGRKRGGGGGVTAGQYKPGSSLSRSPL